MAALFLHFFFGQMVGFEQNISYFYSIEIKNKGYEKSIWYY